VTWLQAVILGADLYVLLSVGAWMVFRALQWHLFNRGLLAADVLERIRDLEQALQRHSALWPREPRPGRYAEIDTRAIASLRGLRREISQSQRIVDELDDTEPVNAPALTVLSLGAWSLLLRTIAIGRERRRLHRTVDSGLMHAATLEEQRELATDIPSRVKEVLRDTQAQVQRLSAHLQTEQDAGTLGLGDIVGRLRSASSEIGSALTRLEETDQQSIPLVLEEIDTIISTTRPKVQQMDQLLTQVSSARGRAEQLAQRVDNELSLAQERWEGLKSRGANEPSIELTLGQLVPQADQLSLGNPRTVEAYRDAESQVRAISADVEELQRRISELDQLVEQSREAIAGDVQALSRAQSACDELIADDPVLDPDVTQAFIEKATQAYMEAERDHAKGTIDGYSSALELSARAQDYIRQAVQALGPLRGQSASVEESLDELASEVLQDWHSRADRVREQLALYKQHWDAGLAGDAAEAVSLLEQAEVDLERVPGNVRYLRRIKQSELGDSEQILSHARDSLDRAKLLVADLERERARIEALHAEVQAGISRLEQEGLQETLAVSEQMLPELQEQTEGLRKNVEEHRRLAENPAKADYDQLADEWLPQAIAEIQGILSAHSRDVQHYRRALKDTVSRLERRWARLVRLSPYDQPGPEEDVEQLAIDIENWQSQSEGQADNPSALREVVGRHATSLEQRIEAARRQITDGRHALELGGREFRKHAQVVRSLRNAIRAKERQSQWESLIWDLDEAERAWERCLALERDSRTVETLVQSNNQLQQAANAAQQAEQLYTLAERQMGQAVKRLDDEYRTAAQALDRGRTRVEQLAQDGPSDQLAALEELVSAAEVDLDLATRSTSFEEALRHIRDAANMLTRV